MYGNEFKVDMNLLNSVFIKDQDELLIYLEDYLLVNGYQEINRTRDYLYAKGDLPVLLVSHCDVEKPHKQIKQDSHLIYDDKTKILTVEDGKTQYLGADDRAGVYGMIELSKEKQYKPYLLFTTDEEMFFFKGVEKFINDHKDDELLKNSILYSIELDDNLASNSSYYDTRNKKFQSWINSYGFNQLPWYKTMFTSTDIVDLTKHFKFSSVNVSVGYYKQHTAKHYLKINELEETIHKTKKILDDTYQNLNSMTKFIYDEKKRWNLMFKFFLLLNKKVTYNHMKNMKFKYYLNKVVAYFVAIVVGGSVGYFTKRIIIFLKLLFTSFIS